MPFETDSDTVIADYSAMAACLFAIQEQETNESFISDKKAQQLLSDFTNDVSELFGQMLKVLGIIDRVENITEDYLIGDFEEDDFLGADFHTGYLDTRNTGYSSRFQTILNVFQYFSVRWKEVSEEDKQTLAAALTPVLNAFNDLQNYLTLVALNPCIPQESAYFNNSPNLYLQAAGSDGIDGTTAGIHLRWSLAGDLFNNHFPKGSLATASSATYNRPDDYIQLYRTPYYNPIRLTLDFQVALPAIDMVSKRWTYVLTSTINDKIISTRVFVSFENKTLYDKLSAISDPYQFLNAYSGLLELELSNKAAFAIGLKFKNEETGTSSKLKIEALSATDVSIGSKNETVTIRKSKEINTADIFEENFSGENIRRIRIKKPDSVHLQSFSFETYNDFSISRTASDWTLLGQEFGLSTDTTKVYNRLDNPQYGIDHHWPHFNDGVTVRVANYQDKWINSQPNEPSILEVINQYIALSETDPRAVSNVRDAGSDPDLPGLDISYLDILNLMAFDYHIARMLGLGYIDAFDSGGQFIYKVRYSNRKNLEVSEYVEHEYMSLPTGKADSRLPQTPAIPLVIYALPVNNDLAENMFDENGYASVADVRIVNIGRQAFNNEIDDDFFADNSLAKDFDIAEHNKPLLYGIEYCKDKESQFIKPEITSDKFATRLYYSYDNGSGNAEILETTPVPDNKKSLFVHFEKEEGVHQYAIYGINWFSRASELSGKVATDSTVFPVKNTLLPPVDVAVQYIQKEDTLLFTTTAEQTLLAGRSALQDANFTRVTFNWLNITDVSGRDLSKVIKPDTIKAYFKHNQPLEVRGVIINLTSVTGMNDQLFVQAGDYTLLDGSPVVPAISNNDFDRFTNSLLSTADGQYRVITVSAGAGAHPLFTIEKASAVETVEDPESPERYGTHKVYKSPEIGSRFTVMENLSNPANWEPISETIQLVDFGNATTEMVTDVEGNETKYLIGGITGEAKILTIDADGTNQQALPGYYHVEYKTGITLQGHPQSAASTNPGNTVQAPYVEWYKGFIRVDSTDGAYKKLLEVVRIISTHPTLTIYAYDPTFQDVGIKMSSPITEYVENVNFHPGYKAYMFPEPAPATFNGSNILPGPQENDKRTLIGLQSADASSGGSRFSSRISSPSILLARKIEEPAQPTAVTPLYLRVRPDATGKAAFTFDTEINLGTPTGTRNPFGFMFYRTTNEDILYALYKPETVATILSELNTLEEDLYYNQRYLELANQIFDPVNLEHYSIFRASNKSYGFPVPDKAGLAEPNNTLNDKKDKYNAAIRGILLPLTEQTPLFEFIKPGKQTENKLPSIRDIDGNLLDPSLANPFPMVRKYPETNPTYIRFTDYTLNASSRYLYFYACSEITVQLTPGPLSPFIGPVYILNTLPAEAPMIRSFTYNSSADTTESLVSISFQLSSSSEQDNISKVRIYRSFDKTQTVSLSTMTSHIDVEITSDTETGIEAIDNFSDYKRVPLGETIYYRLAAVRTIINENNESEDVLSLGSDIIIIKLIDSINPSAPDLIYKEEEKSLSWQPTTNKGTYYLFKQNARGNWEKIPPPYTVNANTMSFTFPTALVLEDEEGNRIYHHFKIKVENSSGLFNLVDNELTI